MSLLLFVGTLPAVAVRSRRSKAWGCGCAASLLILLVVWNLVSTGSHITYQGTLRAAASRGQHIASSIAAYRGDHGGHYPAKLEDLVKEKYIEPSVFAEWQPSRSTEVEPGLDWTYVPGKSSSPKTTPSAVLLYSPPLVTHVPLWRWWFVHIVYGDSHMPLFPMRIVVYDDADLSEHDPLKEKATAKILSEKDFQMLMKSRT